jgi:hypothetical protein
VQLGGPKLKQANRRGIASNMANADRFASNVVQVIQLAGGATSVRAIAKALNARGVATARGGVWTPVQVTAVLRRGREAHGGKLVDGTSRPVITEWVARSIRHEP